jgi:O-methyltransferase
MNPAQSLTARNSANDIIAELRESYIQLVQDILTGIIYEDAPLSINGSKVEVYDPLLREHGWDWPSKAFTMVGVKRLLNFRNLIENVIGHGVPGDIIETGVWRGGACILARAVLKTYNVTDRKVILCDSFAGLPKPNPNLYPADIDSEFHKYSELAVSLQKVKENFKKFRLLDDQVVFVEGLFKDTFPTMNVDKIAVLRLDGDMYESTIDSLRHLYDHVSANGWVIIDDYEVVPACKQAVHDFFAERHIQPILSEIDGVGRYFQKAISY